MSTRPYRLLPEQRVLGGVPLAEHWGPRTPAPTFGGKTYDADRDEARLKGQLRATFQVMSDGRWWTLVELAAAVSKLYGRRVSEAAISARIRDLRKPKFGGHKVEPDNRGGGLWYYRLTVRKP